MAELHVCYPIEGRDEPPLTHEPLMPTGWPRPPSRDGLPVPFIASSLLDLGHVHADRRQFVIEHRRCQVCGDPLGDTAVVCSRPHDEFVVDGAAIHPQPCWPVAAKRCPHLHQLIADGRLDVWHVPTSSLTVAATGILVAAGGMQLGYLRPTVDPG